MTRCWIKALAVDRLRDETRTARAGEEKQRPEHAGRRQQTLASPTRRTPRPVLGAAAGDDAAVAPATRALLLERRSCLADNLTFISKLLVKIQNQVPADAF